jgi:hypothetical protein
VSVEGVVPTTALLADALAQADSAATELGAGSVAGQGLLPFVVAANSGGRFNPDGAGSGEARDGYWRGYSVVRVPADGDPRKLIVEQRPVFDWVGITAQEHTLRPGQKMTLRGLGREPIGSRFSIGSRARKRSLSSSGCERLVTATRREGRGRARIGEATWRSNRAPGVSPMRNASPLTPA